MILALILALGATQEDPKLADERVIFHTTLGNLTFVLYPDVAPAHYRQFLAMARARIYDSTVIHRVEPGFVVQFAGHHERGAALGPMQQPYVRRLKAEFGALRHARGVLSMAHPDGDPDGADTSFSILLGDAPHLDGKYTIFGRLQEGWDVLESILAVPRTGARPEPAIVVTHTEVISSMEYWNRPILTRGAPPVVPPASSSPSGAVYGLIGAMMACGLGAFLAAGRFGARVAASFGLMTVLLGFFACFMLLTPGTRGRGWLAVVLFVGTLAVIKLMNRFEGPATK
jgi:cyclophilin family peptidyl-prolyl cis-trans isomerase